MTRLRPLVQRFRVSDLRELDSDLQNLGQKATSKDVKAVIAHLRARVLAREGKAEQAQAQYAASQRVASISGPAHAWAEIEVLVASGDERKALARLVEFRRQWPKFQWARADLLYSRLYERVGPATRAADEALALYDKSHLHLPQDELLARAARVMAKDQPVRSGELWKRLLLRHPESAFVEEAARVVDPASLSDSEKFDRADRLFAKRDYERCRQVSLDLWSRGVRREAVGYFLGKIGSERLRDDYDNAVTYFEAASVEGAPYALQALSSLGIALSKVGRHDEALAAFDAWLRRFASAPLGRRLELQYDRARALYMAGKPFAASDALRLFLEENRKGIDDFLKYWWFVGWWRYRGGDDAEAIRLMAPLLASGNPLVGGKARYWTAKALDRMGKRADAIAGMVEVVRKYPLTYYSGLAEDVLASWGKANLIPKRPDLSRVHERHPDPFAGLPALPQLQRLRLATLLGEVDAAELVFEEVAPVLKRKLGSKRFAAFEALLDDDLERFAHRRQQAYRRHSKVLRNEPTVQTVAAWRAIYPRAYATHVVHAAKRHGAPEWMVYAHMLQESRYKPWLISNAPAYGLLELLDRTARRLADEASEDYQLWMLMQPEHNVRWGTQYLGALYKKFEQQLPFAIASYNGGPMLLEYHMAVSSEKSLGLDEMIDDLSTHECRNYVRMVIGHFLRYLAIYESPKRAAELRAQLLPKAWRARWSKQPDY